MVDAVASAVGASFSTLGDAIDRQKVHPQTGYTWRFFPPLPVVGGGRLALVVTASADIGCIASMRCEE